MSDENKDLVRTPTMTTLDLLRRWSHSKKDLERVKQQINRCECELLNAENALGKFMVPDVSDNMDEPFHIWLADGLLTAKRVAQNTYRVSWRKEPSPKAAINMQL